MFTACFWKEVALSVLYLVSPRLLGMCCCPALTKQPRKGESSCQKCGTQVEPLPEWGQRSVNVMFPHGKSPALIQTLAQVCRIPQQHQHHLVGWKQANSPWKIQGHGPDEGHWRAYPSLGSKAYTHPCPAQNPSIAWSKTNIQSFSEN